MMKIIPAENHEQIEAARRLFKEYGYSLNTDLSFQNFEKELANLPGGYTAPSGCLLLAEINRQFVGCIALRKFDAQIGEMKRLYVQPPFRKKGVGKLLIFAVIEEARKLEYERLRLDTLAFMTDARKLYQLLGFYEIPAYCHNPLARTVFMEMKL